MRKVNITVRTLREMISDGLPSDVVEKAKSNCLQMISVDFYFVTDFWKEILNEIGFENPTILHSGFSCQGDGACFDAKPNIHKLLDFFIAGHKADPNSEELIPLALSKMDWVSLGSNHSYNWLTILTDSLYGRIDCIDTRYVHANTRRFVVEGSTERYEIDKCINDFEHDVEKLRYKLSNAIYKDLEETYWAETSEEALIESSEVNEWMFDESGNLWN